MTTAYPAARDTWRSSIQARIDAQATLVARMEPGSEAHRLATSVLLLLQDGLFVMSEARGLIEAARRMSRERHG